jgi:hypothetical protein
MEKTMTVNINQEPESSCDETTLSDTTKHIASFDLIEDAKKEVEICERPSRKTSLLLIIEVEQLRENLRLADMLIDKIDDKKYKQMITTYRNLIKSS